jgi:hypothetical protein
MPLHPGLAGNRIPGCCDPFLPLPLEASIVTVARDCIFRIHGVWKKELKKPGCGREAGGKYVERKG